MGQKMTLFNNNKLFHSAQQCRTTKNSNKESNNKPPSTTSNSDTPAKHIKQQNTANKPLCNRCHSDRQTRHISPHCRAEICLNTWCNKLFHNKNICRTPKEKQNNTENNNKTIKTEA